MLVDRRQKSWILITLAAFVAALASYLVYVGSTPQGPTGGSPAGLAFGVAGSLLMLFAALLALRKRLPAWPLGSAKFWLAGHVWLGGLSVPLILFHAGFRFGGTFETILMWAFLIVALTGVHGLVMQNVLPRLMTISVPRETFVQQIPYQCRRMQVEADQLIADLSGEIDADPAPLRDAAFQVAAGQGKLRGGKREAEDFEKFLVGIYGRAASNGEAGDDGSHAAASPEPAERAAEAASQTKDSGSTRPSPLEQARRAGAKGPPAEGASPQKSPAQPKSPLEQARAAGAGDRSAKADGGPRADAGDTDAAKPKSPLERARAAGTGQSGPKASQPGSGAGKADAASLSPLERARAAGTGQSGPESSTADEATDSESEKPDEASMSPLERARAAGTGKSERKASSRDDAGEAGHDTADAASTSPLERARAAGSGGGSAAGKKTHPDSSPDDAGSGSPLERARAAGSGQAASTPSTEDSTEAEKPDAASMSPLERARAAGAGKQESKASNRGEATEGGSEKAAGASMSPLERARAAGAGKASPSPQEKQSPAEKGESSSPAAKPQSKLEQARAAVAAGKSQGAKDSGKPAAPGKQAVEKKTPPPASGKPRAAASKARPEPSPEPALPEQRLEELRRFYLDAVRPFLSEANAHRCPLRDESWSKSAFAKLRQDLPPQLHPPLHTLEDLCDTRRQYLRERRFHFWLHNWLYLHVPVSMALVVLFVIHVYTALAVVPW